MGRPVQHPHARLLPRAAGVVGPKPGYERAASMECRRGGLQCVFRFRFHLRARAPSLFLLFSSFALCVRVCVCARACVCVRACVRTCARARVCVGGGCLTNRPRRCPRPCTRSSSFSAQRVGGRRERGGAGRMRQAKWGVASKHDAARLGEHCNASTRCLNAVVSPPVRVARDSTGHGLLGCCSHYSVLGSTFRRRPTERWHHPHTSHRTAQF